MRGSAHARGPSTRQHQPGARRAARPAGQVFRSGYAPRASPLEHRETMWPRPRCASAPFSSSRSSSKRAENRFGASSSTSRALSVAWPSEASTPTGALEHLLHQVAHRVGGEDRGRELRDAAASHEHPARRVDPHLFDCRVVEVTLQWSETRDRVEDPARGHHPVAQRREDAAQRAVVVLRDHLIDEPAHGTGVGGRVQPPSADELTHLVLDDFDRVHPTPSSTPAGQGNAAEPRQMCGSGRPFGRHLWTSCDGWCARDRWDFRVWMAGGHCRRDGSG